jgi:hypothetical protein
MTLKYQYVKRDELVPIHCGYYEHSEQFSQEILLSAGQKIAVTSEKTRAVKLLGLQGCDNVIRLMVLIAFGYCIN